MHRLYSIETVYSLYRTEGKSFAFSVAGCIIGWKSQKKKWSLKNTSSSSKAVEEAIPSVSSRFNCETKESVSISTSNFPLHTSPIACPLLSNKAQEFSLPNFKHRIGFGFVHQVGITNFLAIDRHASALNQSTCFTFRFR